MSDIYDIFAEIVGELPRSVSLHPDEEWAAKSFTAMHVELDKEIKEIMKAWLIRDYTGEHGVYQEINHAIIVLLRMRIELERREHGRATS